MGALGGPLLPGTVRQEVVDEGGMNLALSLFSTAVQQADVLLACFPLLQQMIAHGVCGSGPGKER